MARKITGVSGSLPRYYKTAYIPSQYGNGLYITPHYVEEYNIEGNYSIIYIDYIQFQSSYYSDTVNWSVSGTININGTDYTYSGSVSTPGHTSTKWPCSIVSNPIYHNTDGTKSTTITLTRAYASGSKDDSGFGTSSGTLSTKSITLTTIPRASKISATSANIGEYSTLTITRYAEAFTHTITYSFGSLSGTIATNSDETSINWTIPTTFYNEIPNAPYGTVSLTCKTYSGSTHIGTSTTTFYAYASQSASGPVISPVARDSNNYTTTLTGDNQKIIKGYSNIYCQINAEARNGATLTEISISNGSTTANTETTIFNNVVSNKFIFTATDSRGFTTSQTITLALINYIDLTCSISADNPNTEGNTILKVNGVYFNSSFGAVNNTLTTEYRYKTKTDDWCDYVEFTPTIEGNSYSANVNITGLDYQKVYTLEVRAIDLVKGVVNSNQYKIRCIPVFDWGEDEFRINVDLVVAGNITSEAGNPLALNYNGLTAEDVVNSIYPIGSIYMNVEEFLPAEQFGGEWEEYTDKPAGFNVYMYKRIG